MMRLRRMRASDIPQITPADVKCLRLVVGQKGLQPVTNEAVEKNAQRNMKAFDHAIAEGFHRAPEEHQPAHGVMLVHPRHGICGVG